ncbi:beta-alanyl-dopamine/carcinine hydrolase [Phlebotomus argentipes]|uniref:beta-alanyl-dopamine/carcinine hydrolase n=1 Tax=Phlebotomus argentipes TaxID=94469 RepID=UPI002892D6F6|nr:beta-alanyl-dopamine/carcinine hydrolase [Phlebotomus argentipes]
MSPSVSVLKRHQAIPVLNTRGTHYEVGFDVGRTFASLIREFLTLSEPLNNTYLPLYNTSEGRAVYNETLNSVRASFPQYIRELEGTADGAQVEFHKLFLLHMDDITPKAVAGRNSVDQPIGCTSICVNQPGEELIAHNEDTLPEVMNFFYLVSAHIVCDEPQGKHKVKEEKFTSLCYAGHLPGYTMGYNHHGLIFTINTLSADTLHSGKTPRHFITRALLSADNFVQAQHIIRDAGVGAADGCSINMTFLRQDGPRVFHNIEMGPAKSNESQLEVKTAAKGEYLAHCNKYLRLPVPEVTGLIIDSSVERMLTLRKLGEPKNRADVIEMLGDESSKIHPVFRGRRDDPIKTIAVGIFDCIARTWTLYSDNPKRNEPLVVLPLVIRD